MKRAAFVLAALLGAAAPASAQNLIVGQTDSGNCYPFICLSADSRTQWQQLYGASAFGANPVNITGLYFFATNSNWAIPNQPWDSGLFTVSLSTTSVSTLGTAGTAFASNIGANNTQIFQGYLTGDVPVGGVALQLSFAPFYYDPSQGNLLLDVSIQGGNGAYITYLDAEYGCTSPIERAYGSNGVADWVDCGGSLVTGFDTNPTNVVPEPMTMTLLGTGLAGVAAARRRRKQDVA